MAISFNNTKQEIDLDDLVTFGKHSGFRWSYVVEDQPDYVIWCVGNTDNNFAKDVIVAAIKSKYKKKAANKSEEHDLDNEANARKFNRPGASNPDIGTSTFFKHHGDSFMGTHSDGWDDDIPF